MKIAITGHRPERLMLPMDEADKEWFEIYHLIRGKIKSFDEPIELYVGMANGVDMVAGMVMADILNVEGIFEEHNRLICVLPCKDYNRSNPNFKYVISYAAEVVTLAEEWYKGCDSERDQYMVDQCDVLIAVWDGIKFGGVWSTIRKAQKAGKKVEIIDVR